MLKLHSKYKQINDSYPHTYFSDMFFTSVRGNYTEKLSFVNKKASAYYRTF